MLVVVEGIDGSGKTTLVERLVRRLEAAGVPDVVRTAEPTHKEWGRYLRALSPAERAVTPRGVELGLFLADRAEHVASVVAPALVRGATVVQDRSYHSTVVYQGGSGFSRHALLEINKSIAPEPDVLFVVDVDPQVALDRIGQRGPASAFETLEDLEHYRRVYRRFFPNTRLLRGDRSADRVEEEAWYVLERVGTGARRGTLLSERREDPSYFSDARLDSVEEGW